MIGNNGVLDDIRILSEESVQEIHNTNVASEWYKQGLATRYQNDIEMPFTGFYWHTGSAWGTFAQYAYLLNDNENSGVVVITTGAQTERLENGMIEVCTDLSTLVWNIFNEATT